LTLAAETSLQKLVAGLDHRHVESGLGGDLDNSRTHEPAAGYPDRPDGHPIS
jgi:hypothetical protein